MAKGAESKAPSKAAAPEIPKEDAHEDDHHEEPAAAVEAPKGKVKAALTGAAAKIEKAAAKVEEAAAPAEEEAAEAPAADADEAPAAADDSKGDADEKSDVVPAKEAPAAEEQVAEQQEKKEEEAAAEPEPEPEPVVKKSIDEIIEAAPTKQLKHTLQTAPIDPRFAAVANQAKYCWTMYNEFLRCTKAKGSAKDELCQEIRGDALSMCPTDWVGCCCEPCVYAGVHTGTPFGTSSQGCALSVV